MYSAVPVQEALQRSRSLEDEGVVAGHSKLTMTNWELSLKLILLRLHEKLLKNSTSTVLQSFDIWSKLERWKDSISGCLMRWPKVKKEIIVLKCCLLFFYAATVDSFSIGLWHVMKSGFYTTSSDDQLSGWTEKKLQSTSQSQTCTTQRSWPLFDGLLPIGSTTAFWILAKSLHLRSMLGKPVRCIENCNVCSRHWSTERAQFFSRTAPDHRSHSQHFKSWTNWAMKFCLICHIHLTSCQLTTTSSSVQNFLQEKCFHSQ